MENQKEFNPRPSAIAENIESSLPKEFHESFARVIKAGMKIIFSEETHGDIIDMINKNEGDIGETLGKQIASLMGILFQKSNNTMPGEVIVPAGTYLLSQGADFIETVTGEEMQPEMIAVAMQVMIDSIMGSFGIDPQQFYSVTEQALAKYEGEK